MNAAERKRRILLLMNDLWLAGYPTVELIGYIRATKQLNDDEKLAAVNLIIANTMTLESV